MFKKRVRSQNRVSRNVDPHSGNVVVLTNKKMPKPKRPSEGMSSPRSGDTLSDSENESLSDQKDLVNNLMVVNGASCTTPRSPASTETFRNQMVDSEGDDEASVESQENNSMGSAVNSSGSTTTIEVNEQHTFKKLELLQELIRTESSYLSCVEILREVGCC